MSKIKKFVTYEFDIDHIDFVNGTKISIPVEYKVDDENSYNNIVCFECSGVSYRIPASILLSISNSMKEINPFDFDIQE